MNSELLDRYLDQQDRDHEIFQEGFEIDNIKYNAHKAASVILNTTVYFDLEERLSDWIYEAWNKIHELEEENKKLIEQLVGYETLKQHHKEHHEND